METTFVRRIDLNEEGPYRIQKVNEKIRFIPERKEKTYKLAFLISLNVLSIMGTLFTLLINFYFSSKHCDVSKTGTILSSLPESFWIWIIITIFSIYSIFSFYVTFKYDEIWFEKRKEITITTKYGRDVEDVYPYSLYESGIEIENNSQNILMDSSRDL